MKDNRTTIYLTKEDQEKLRDIAESLGYVNDKGPTAGKGGISALMQAIAKGDKQVVDVNTHGWYSGEWVEVEHRQYDYYGATIKVFTKGTQLSRTWKAEGWKGDTLLAETDDCPSHRKATMIIEHRLGGMV